MKTLSKSKGVKEIRVIGQHTQLDEELHRRRVEQFMRENPLVLDDDIAEKFNIWMSNLESK